LGRLDGRGLMPERGALDEGGLTQLSGPGRIE
jgi:hypothetical protein